MVKQVTALNQHQADEARREALILRRLDHPNVVAFFESFVCTSLEDGAALHIVMEFCDGGDLDQVIKRQRSTGKVFEEAYVMRIFVQLLLALKYVHAQKILHRDIKPQNVVLTFTLEFFTNGLITSPALIWWSRLGLPALAVWLLRD